MLPSPPCVSKVSSLFVSAEDGCVSEVVVCVADNKIGVEGAARLAEALKTNATVTFLDLSCEWGTMLIIGMGSAVFTSKRVR